MPKRLDTFNLFIKDSCKACEGMVGKAANFARDNNMFYKIYNNSTEVLNTPAVSYCEFLIIGNKAFDKLGFLVKEKREGRL